MSDETPAAAPVRPQVRVTTSSGSITIIAEVRDDVEVASGNKVERRQSSQHDEISVRRSSSVNVRCPVGADVVAGTSSGSVTLSGTFGDVRVTSSSGSLSVGDVGSADLRTASGDIELDRCAGTCRATSASGSVDVGEAGDVEISATSGKTTLSCRSARVRTVSGNVELDARGDASVNTVSGTVTISLPPDVHPRVVARGLKKPRIRVVEGNDCEISVRSVSGSVTVRSV